MTHTFPFEYTDDVLASIGLSEREFATVARFMVAAQLYAEGRLSTGQAANLSGMEKVEFLHQLAQRGYPASNLRPEDAATELEFARGR